MQVGPRRSDSIYKPVSAISSSAHNIHSQTSQGSPSVRRSSRLFTLSSNNSSVGNLDSNNKVCKSYDFQPHRNTFCRVSQGDGKPSIAVSFSEIVFLQN